MNGWFGSKLAATNLIIERGWKKSIEENSSFALSVIEGLISSDLIGRLVTGELGEIGDK